MEIIQVNVYPLMGEKLDWTEYKHMFSMENKNISIAASKINKETKHAGNIASIDLVIRTDSDEYMAGLMMEKFIGFDNLGDATMFKMNLENN